MTVEELSVGNESALLASIERARVSLDQSASPKGAKSPPVRDLLQLLSSIQEHAGKLNRSGIQEQAAALSARIGSASGPLAPEALSQLRSGLDALRAAVESSKSPSEAESVPEEIATDPELLNDFILESGDYLAQVETHLLAIEKNPEDSESIHAVFRAFHTIKGLAGFLGIGPIQEVAHEIENVLDRAREGRLAIDSGVIDLVLRAADYLKDCIGLLSAPGARVRSSSDFPPNQALLAVIRQVESGGGVSAAGRPVSQPAAAQRSDVQTDEPKTARAAGGASTVKVDTIKLEYLVDMIGELVIAESIVRHDPVLTGPENPALTRNLAQLARVTEEVQKTAMSMRMVPIGRLFGKMERLIRDLARKSGKQIQLRTAGEHAELDRNIVEELADPMVHMIRNSVDHGLEMPDERVARGKPAMGTIGIEAHHEAGCIIIRITDDGRGLDRARILAKAKERGLAPENARLSDEEVYRLIFQPGFSTAEKVTDISGRGVGMDVVSRHIQKLRGRIEIKSTQGQGCIFTLRLPLTLAIIDGLVVGVGNERYIVPIFSMREMFSSNEDTRFTIEGKSEMVLFRGALLPVVRLCRKFQIESPGQGNVLIVIQGRDREFCLAVDQLIGKQEVVIKSLGSCFANLPGIAGGAILGDGRVGLILDVDTLGGALAPSEEAPMEAHAG